jgi:hypothetical protein
MEVPETLALTGLGEVAVRVKLVTVKIAFTEWVRVPLVPVIVRV